ncbi:hypothetical protein NDN08_006008 [Rhodosorus marinus]|uniref:Gamma-glutamylcyclotransferase family protein n=1 Tax=Rhodosorus marinus TaxID=101924 RepID=A0AAV8UJH7_9RHOD|nr:hypothetical protein NDN08_006008 [Rhodosorus marinus]
MSEFSGCGFVVTGYSTGGAREAVVCTGRDIGKVGMGKMKEKRHHVFVYGTLKRGFPNHHLLREANYEGTFRTDEKFPLVIGGEFFSPYLLHRPGEGSQVKGEVFRVDDKMLSRMDELERVGVNYTRKVVKVHNGDNVTEVYAYLKCNYTEELLEAEHHDEYLDRRYVPRHLRPKVEVANRMELAAVRS